MEIMIKKLKQEVFSLRQKLDEIAQGSLDPSGLRLNNLDDDGDGGDRMVDVEDLEGANADQRDGRRSQISTLNGAEGPSSA